MINVIFFGTPEFAIPALEALWKLSGSDPDSLALVAVITAPDKPVGRRQILTPPPAKVWAQAHNVPVMQPDRIRAPEWRERILHLHADMGVIAAYGQIIPKEIIEAPRYGVVNVHPSLLPRGRGPSPVQFTILHGDPKTGVSLMLTDKEMDHGPILAQEILPLAGNENAEELTEKLAAGGGALLVKTLPAWLAGRITPQPQHEANATYSKMLSREDGKIDWSQSAQEIERKVRALYPWPGTYAEMKNEKGKMENYPFDKLRASNQKLKIIKTRIRSQESRTGEAGEVLADESGVFAVQCGNGHLEILTVQPEGKKEMAGADFLRGHKNLLGAILQ